MCERGRGILGGHLSVNFNQRIARSFAVSVHQTLTPSLAPSQGLPMKPTDWFLGAFQYGMFLPF